MSNMQVFDTPEAISYFQLATVKSALKMEQAGLKSRRAIRPLWAAKLGLKPRDSYDKFIQAIEARMSILRGE